MTSSRTASGRWRITALFVFGALLLQAAWVLALPPFRGTDEFDHAYRAAAVAGGQWQAPGEAAKHGRGELVIVPRSFVAAAHPVCASLNYTGHDNCNPVADAGQGRVEVASAAATYNPVFYWVVGSVAAPFSGDGALYAMRLAAALLCAVMIGLAAWVTSHWARSMWPWAGLVVAASPVVVFSTAVAAPNGLEMCAAVALWMSLLGLHDRRAALEHQRALLVSATVGAVVVTTLRSIGPLWVALIVLTAVLPLGLPRIVGLMRRTPLLVAICSALVLVATLASVWWTRSAGTNALEPVHTDVTNRWTATLYQVPLWLLQSIAAFPRRGIPAPAVVYVCAALVFAALVGYGFVMARRRLRATMAATAVVALAVPMIATVLTIEVASPVWQGRYGLPYTFGLVLLAAAALDAARASHRGPWLVLGWLLLVVAQTVSVVHVLQVELRTSPLAGSPDWVTAPTAAVASAMVVGLASWAMAVVVADRTAGRLPEPAASDSLAP